MEGRTITDIFLNPLPHEVDAVNRERESGLAEIELVLRSQIDLTPVQPEAPIHSEHGAVIEEAPQSQKGDGK